MDKLYYHHKYLEPSDNYKQIKDFILSLKGKKTLLDADKLECTEQLLVSVFRANRAEENGSMLANTWGIEVYLQLAGIHQIKPAIELFDIHSDTKLVIVVCEYDKIDNFIKGLPEIGNYQNDDCKKIIAKGARFITDYE